MFPKLVLSARNRKSPFFDGAVEAGMTHATVYNHMYMPVSYGDPEAEYKRLIEGVAMWDVGVERQVELAGPDAMALAAYLTPRDLSKCKAGQGKYAPLCGFEGQILNDPVLLKLSEELVWLSIADSDMLYWAQAIANMKGFDCRVSEPDVSPLAVQGPLAVEVIARLFGDWVRDLKYFWFQETELDGIPLVLARSGWSKQGGYELYLRDGSRGLELWRLIAEAGRDYGIGPGAPNAVERIESGLLSIGADTDRDSDPFECNLGHLIALDREQDFVGKQALLAKREAGLRRRLVGLTFGGAPVGGNEHPWPLLRDGESIGTARAAAYSPRLATNIALALVDCPHDAPGTHIAVDCLGNRRTATATVLPFIL
ncbi:MAG: glycine cleavage system protein T [Rhodospirillales bacterium]|nr:glycine cleavage system protein T [Rhodospirillales bacterium]